MVCIFFFSFFSCYLNTKLCHPLLIFMFRMELCLQRCHCMTTDLCRLSETDQPPPPIPPLCPPCPGWAQELKCLKNTCLSAGAAAKTILSSHFNKTRPLERKVKEKKSPLSSPSGNSLKTHCRDKEKTMEMADGGTKEVLLV